MRDEKEGRKKEVSKVKQTKRQSNTAHPRQSLFLRKKSCLYSYNLPLEIQSLFIPFLASAYSDFADDECSVPGEEYLPLGPSFQVCRYADSIWGTGCSITGYSWKSTGLLRN